MAISKIILNGVTQMDVTQDTVASSNLLSGYTATKNDGTQITGSYVVPEDGDNITYGTITAVGTWYFNNSTALIPDADFLINGELNDAYGTDYDFTFGLMQCEPEDNRIAFVNTNTGMSTTLNIYPSYGYTMTITITGGADIENATLLEWLTTGATKQ